MWPCAGNLPVPSACGQPFCILLPFLSIQPRSSGALIENALHTVDCIKLREHVTPLAQSSGAPSAHYRTIAARYLPVENAMVPWHPTFRMCRSSWVKGVLVSHDWILGLKSIFSFTGVQYAAVRERGTLTRSKVACQCPVTLSYSGIHRSTVHSL
jgi:hypothetical protein